MWGVGGLLLLWAIAWLAVPPIVKAQAEKAASAQLGRQVRIGSVDFRPWTLELTIHDLSVAGPAGAPPQLAVKRIYIDAELQSLLRLAPVVDAVTVEGVDARLVHLGGGRYDIDDVLARLAARPPADPAAEPARFALYNLSVKGGSFDFDDKAVGKVQQLRDLQVSLPFLSNLASDREVKVEPRLAFKLNGSNFDSAAQGTPFAQSRKTDASIKLSAFDLRPWLGYIPAAVPVRVQTAVLDADLRLAFEQSPKLAVRLSGSVTASGVKVADVQGQPLLGFESLRVDLADVRPLEREAALAAVALTGPRLDVLRDRGGRLNLAALLGPPPPAAVPTPPASAPASSAKAGAVPAASPWKLSVAKVEVRAGTVAWADASTTPKADLMLRDVVLDASALALPFAQSMPFSGSAALDGKQPASFAFSGSATDQAASVTLTVSALPLTAAAPYLAQQMTPSLAGSVTGEFGLAWKAQQLTQAAGKQQDIQLAIRSLVLDKLALTQGKAQLASIQKLELLNSQVDVGRQSVNLGKLSIVQPKAGVERGEDGRWMFEQWMKGAPEGAVVPAAAAVAAPAAQPWTLALGELLLSGGSIQFQDKSRARPVNFQVSALQVQARNFSLDGKKPSPFSVSARIGAGQTEPGKLDFRGAAAIEPLTVQGQVDAADLPLHAFEPYFGDALNIELLRADASFKGRVRFAQAAGGPSLKVTGDTALEEFRANSVQVQPQSGGQGTATMAARGLQAAEELLSWRALSLRGLDLTMAPGAATLVDVKETVLSDFFARIIINETGRINLQDVVKASVPAGTTSTMAATATATLTPTAVATAAVSPAATGSATPPVISFGPVSLLNGKVLFSDRFVKPNYTANLTELNGKLSAFSSTSPLGTPTGAPQMADLELRGRAEGTASLEVLGKLNPLAKPLALDIKGKVRDLELPPLSPYSIKYAGHGIERGKLSLDVAYLVKPDGQLTASNRLVLNQLGFGEAVPGAPASLPVKLAVALLADRNGMIDIDLPVSGSLNDPQFRLGPVIFKIIINVITKALTAPFSLLAGAFGGGGDELNIVVFSPGTAVLEPEAQKGLDKVAKALADRPGLKMTVVGTASLDVEREAMKRERLKQAVQAEKRRESVVAGGTATGLITVSDSEYPALLKEVYKRADIKKPRNMIGMAKDLPQGEMEELLLANVVVTEETMRELAVQRGVAVRDYLASQKLPLDRLFLGAAKAVAPEARWSPRAELNLAAQ